MLGKCMPRHRVGDIQTRDGRWVFRPVSEVPRGTNPSGQGPTCERNDLKSVSGVCNVYTVWSVWSPLGVQSSCHSQSVSRASGVRSAKTLCSVCNARESGDDLKCPQSQACSGCLGARGSGGSRLARPSTMSHVARVSTLSRAPRVSECLGSWHGPKCKWCLGVLDVS